MKPQFPVLARGTQAGLGRCSWLWSIQRCSQNGLSQGRGGGGTTGQEGKSAPGGKRSQHTHACPWPPVLC